MFGLSRTIDAHQLASHFRLCDECRVKTLGQGTEVRVKRTHNDPRMMRSRFMQADKMFAIERH